MVDLMWRLFFCIAPAALGGLVVGAMFYDSLVSLLTFIILCAFNWFVMTSPKPKG